MTGGGLCWLDYDGDGWLDLFVVNGHSRDERDEWEARGGLPTTRLFRNRDGRFTDVTEETGAGCRPPGPGLRAADLDDDGHTDLYVTGADRSTLLWNDGEEFAEADEDPPRGCSDGTRAPLPATSTATACPTSSSAATSTRRRGFRKRRRASRAPTRAAGTSCS